MGDDMRKVKVRMTAEYEIEVPIGVDDNLIEFNRNEGGWCATNAISELLKLSENNDGCICEFVTYQVVESVDTEGES